MMDRAQVLSQQLPEKFVAGQLSAAEEAEFQEYMLEHPEVVEQVELAQRLKLGLQTLSDRGELQTLVAERPRRNSLWFAAAAALVIAAMGISFYFHNAFGTPAPVLASSLEQLDARVRALPAVAAVTLVRLRDDTSATRLELAPDSGVVPLQILTGAPAGTSYDVVLRRAAEPEREIATLPAVATDSGGTVHIFLDASTLENGRHAVELRRKSAEPVSVESYLIEIVRSD
jgi:hypothetical protein